MKGLVADLRNHTFDAGQASREARLSFCLFLYGDKFAYLITSDMAKKKYQLHLKGYVGSWDFDADYVDYILDKNADKEVSVLIDSLGG